MKSVLQASAQQPLTASTLQFTTLKHIVKRGSAHLLVLKAISKRPMHSYDFALEISAISDGLYRPSPGMIYPTFQWLEDNGYIEGHRQEGKNFCSISRAGNDYRLERTDAVREILDHLKNIKKDPEYSVLRSASKLQKTIVALLPTLTMDERASIAMILDETNDRIVELMK